VLSSRRAAELERVRAACADPSKVAVLPLDLLKLDATAAARDAASAFGPIDILVNNAGVSQRGFVIDTRMDVYRQIMELDFFAPVALTQAVLPGMRDRHGGHVVMVGSVVSKVGTPLRSGYAAAKHALLGFTEAARVELWRDGVHFTFAMPGFVHTSISINALAADGSQHARMDPATAKGMSPDVCAEAIWKAVEGDVEEIVIGGKEAAFLQLKRFAPRLFARALKGAKVS
jgi:short-subunit dehydrogenase